MAEESLLLTFTGNAPFFRVLDFLVENKGMDFSKKDIAEGAGISKASLFNYWPQLEGNRIVKVTRQFGKTKLYTLNSASDITQKLLALEAALIRAAMTRAKKENSMLAEV
jgi:hypothetical protein